MVMGPMLFIMNLESLIESSLIFSLPNLHLSLQVKLGSEAPNSKVVKVPGGAHGLRRRSSAPNMTNSGGGGGGGGSVFGTCMGDECRLLDFESSDRPLVVNFGSAT